jgi:hypothetical protein
MPNYDRRGPNGNGPGTGRGNGLCRAGNRRPDGDGWGNRIGRRLRQRCRRFADSVMPERFGAGFQRGGRMGRSGSPEMLPQGGCSSRAGRMRGGMGKR